jgi:hypothetical protein
MVRDPMPAADHQKPPKSLSGLAVSGIPTPRQPAIEKTSNDRGGQPKCPKSGPRRLKPHRGMRNPG